MTTPEFLKSAPENIFFRCVEDSSEAIMITDERGFLVYVNPAWTRIYGYTQEEALGSSPKLLHSGRQDDEFYLEMWSQIRDRSKGFWKGELINRAKNGALIPVLLTITPFRNRDNQDILGYMGIAIDVSEQKRMESQILRQDRLASIGMIASGLAHEIGTPLGVIRGRAELILMRNELSEAGTAGLNTIIEQIDRIYRLISSLLRFSRSSEDTKLSSIDLVGSLAEVMSLLAEKLRKTNIEIENLVPEGTRVLADPVRLQQVFVNLAINSIHAIEQRQAASHTRLAPGRIQIEVAPNKSAAYTDIHFIDNGCGIPPQNLPKLFQPFFTTKDVGEGTGLGLAIVGKLLTEMGAEISVESVENVGTKFIIHLKKSQK